MTENKSSTKCRIEPSPAIAGVKEYAVPKTGLKIDLHLDGNEGPFPSNFIVDEFVKQGMAVARNYPSARPLEAQIARLIDVSPDQVLVTSGGDDALFRACHAVLAPGREIVIPVPTFEMIARFANLAGGSPVTVPWREGPYPCGDVLKAATGNTAAVAVVTPNNPTGAVATREDILRLSNALPGALIIVDLAYGEFADVDLMPVAISQPNTVAIRSCSKAWGMAGLRIGYAAGPVEIIDWMRASGSPYAVSGPSIVMGSLWIERGVGIVNEFVKRIKEERRILTDLLMKLGADPLPSQANFVFARYRDAAGIWKMLAESGIAVRFFPGKKELENCLRITCPGNQKDFDRLLKTLKDVAKVGGF